MTLQALKPYTFTRGESAHFVGFHDIIPWSKDESHLLVHRASNDTIKSRSANDWIEVCVWDLMNDTVTAVGETNTWNWQQGARLQWIPKSDQIVFNYRDAMSVRAKILEMDGSTIQELDRPVYSVDSDGRWMLSYNFSRLAKHWKGYGYADTERMSETDVNEIAPSNDGLFLLDGNSGKSELIVSLAATYEMGLDASIAQSPRFFTHATFSPSGQRVAFFERFHTQEGQLYSRFFTVDRDGGNLQLLCEGKQSHFDWFDDDTLLIWSRSTTSMINQFHKKGIFSHPFVRPIIRSLRKFSPSLKARVSEEYFRLYSVESKESKPFAKGILTEDGHPMFSKKRDWLICDTYPNRQSCQPLILINVARMDRIDLVWHEVPSVFQDLDLKCDLHPRWNHGSNQVCVDSSHSGKRQVYLYDLSTVMGTDK